MDQEQKNTQKKETSKHNKQTKQTYNEWGLAAEGRNKHKEAQYTNWTNRKYTSIPQTDNEYGWVVKGAVYGLDSIVQELSQFDC